MITSLNSTDSFLPEFDSLPRWLLIPFLIISVIESIIGIVGNLFVIIVILRLNKSNIPQTSHNCFIVNLALSDFVLCLFTMPLNTYRSLNVYMTFPPAFCKLADSFPAINICVSSLTIVTISIYRYLLVCYPHKKFIGIFSTFMIMTSIWVLAIGAASPLFIYSRSIPAYDEDVIDEMVNLICGQSLNDSCGTTYYKIYERLHVCHESWPKHGELRLLYTIFMLFLQFILPILIICITYYQVMVKLRERFRYRFLMKRQNISSLRQEIRRQRRNNVLLLLIVSLYAISWLPFNIFYILFTYVDRFRTAGVGHSFQDVKVDELSKYLPLRFLICMISAISNPFLYSYFNETFKEGLKRFFSSCIPQSNRRIKQVSFDQRGFILNQKKLQKKSNGNLRSSCYQSSIIGNGNTENSASISRPSHDPTTRLTILSTYQISHSIASHD